MFDLRKRLAFLIPAALAALVQHTIHETTHYAAARLFGVEVVEFRFLTNGLLTSQVVYGTPVPERVGAEWLVIGWAPAVVTVLIGYALFAARRRWLTNVRVLNAGLWFATAYFLIVDPLYFAVLAPLVGGGGDVAAAAAVGWPRWPVHAAAGLILIVNGLLVHRLRQEGKAEPERYLASR